VVAAGEVGFAGEGGLGTEGIEVEMEGNGGEGLACQVFVGDGLSGVEGLFVGVEAGVDVVGDDAGGEGLAARGVRGDAGLGIRLGICLGLQGLGCEKDHSDSEESDRQHTGIVGLLFVLVRKKFADAVDGELLRRKRGRGGLPEFGEEKTGEMMVVRDSSQTTLREGGDVVGEMGGSETGEDAECEIECADGEFCWKPHRAAGDAEVRGEPESSGGEGGSDAGDEGFECGLGEAVEEEVGDDEVVGFCFDGEGQGAGVVDLETVGGGRFAPLAEELEHGGAGVDCIGLDVWVASEKLREEATVSIAEDECLSLLEEVREIVKATAFESSAKS
jgi:hypothetical protein